MMKTFFLIAPIAWRNLWRRGTRTVLTMVTVALAVASMMILGSFMRSWGQSAFDRTVAAMNAHGQIHARGFMDDPTLEYSMPPPSTALLQALNNPSIKAWAPRVVASAMVRSERESAPVRVYGINPQREARLSFVSKAVAQGRYFTEPADSGVLLGRLLVDRLQVKLGHRVVLTAQDAKGDIAEIGVKVIGIYQGQPELEKFAVYLPITQAQTFLGLDRRSSEIAYLANRREQVSSVTAMLRAAAPDLDVRSWSELQPFTRAIIEITDNTNAIWGFVSFALVAFGLVNTLLMAVYERLREFGLLQALGMKPAWLLMQIMLESCFLVIPATLSGAVVGAAVILSFSDGLNLGSWGAGARMIGASQVLYPQFDLRQTGIACAVVIGLSILASIYPAVRAARRVPVDVITRAQV